MFQNVLRSIISLLVTVLVVLSALGMVWWKQPPDKLSSYEQGGKLILGLLIVSGIAGLWVLWSPTKRKDA